MSYIDELEKMSVSDLLKKAAFRVDGIAMYFVCALCLFFAAYTALYDWFSWSLPIPELKRLGGLSLLLFIPITLVGYISLLIYSTPGRIGRVVNAIVLMGIPFYFAYKLNLFI